MPVSPDRRAFALAIAQAFSDAHRCRLSMDAGADAEIVTVRRPFYHSALVAWEGFFMAASVCHLRSL